MRRLRHDLGAYLARPLADNGPGLERVLLHPGRPDRAGADPRAGGPSAVLEPGGLRPRPPRLSRHPGLGRPRDRPTLPERAGAVCVVVLAPRSRRPAPPGLGRLHGGPGALHPGPVQPCDGSARLGDRGLDRAAFAGDALRLRPDRLDPGALPGRHGGERAGGLARPLYRPRPPGAGADRAAAWRRSLGRPAGGARGDGLGQPGAAADPAPPGPDLRHGGPGEASGAGVVVGYGHLGDAGLGRVQPARLHLDGRLALCPERLDSRRPGARAGAMAS